MRIHLHIIVALLFANGALGNGDSQEKHSGAAGHVAKLKRKKILAEIKKFETHDWAGDYYAGDGLGVNTSLVLAPSSGYVFEWHGCLGLYDRNYGGVVETNNRIRLSFTFENTRKGFEGIAPEFIPVKWGTRRYLIPADGIVDFCNNINEGREPRTKAHGFCLLRRGDENQKVSGFPKLPEEYQHYLLAKPIEATIVAVGKYTTRPSVTDWKFKDTPVTLDKGTKQGLRVGMELTVTKPRDIVESVRITKVEETRSEAIMVQAGEESLVLKQVGSYLPKHRGMQKGEIDCRPETTLYLVHLRHGENFLKNSRAVAHVALLNSSSEQFFTCAATSEISFT
jgi:hypothetical protein